MDLQSVGRKIKGMQYGGYLHSEHELAAVSTDCISAGALRVPQLLHHRTRKLQHPHYPLHAHKKDSQEPNQQQPESERSAAQVVSGGAEAGRVALPSFARPAAAGSPKPAACSSGEEDEQRLARRKRSSGRRGEG
nr:unnamed protein product [Digitaria exilis]